MKSIFKQKAGLTLIELVVAMAMATIVTAAATSVLLMGLRINRQTGDTASQQITVRQLLTTMDRILAEGNIQSYEADAESWRVFGKDKSNAEKVLLSYLYDPEQQSGMIYVGDYADQENPGTPVLSGLLSSFVQHDNHLLTVTVETKTGMYSTSAYCRMVDFGPATESTDATAEAFIKLLRTQFRSKGEIIYTTADPKKPEDYTYYSEWYIGGYTGDWSENTPWCACFVSWALGKVGMLPPDYCNDPKHTSHTNWYANVDEFMEYFKDTEQPNSRWEDSKAHGGTYSPKKGDLIFFDWDKGTDPEHIGVVTGISEDGRYIYTIEGNSAGRVAIRSYPISDKRIIGYGVLWPETSQG